MAASEPQGIWTLQAPPSPSCLWDVREMKAWTGLGLIHLFPAPQTSHQLLRALSPCLPVPFMTVSRGQLI